MSPPPPFLCHTLLSGRLLEGVYGSKEEVDPDCNLATAVTIAPEAQVVGSFQVVQAVHALEGWGNWSIVERHGGSTNDNSKLASAVGRGSGGWWEHRAHVGS